ncbi:unnamed protein product [Brachionus calyciflorus]|uniref:Ubiquitin-like domain-containing protein n=1 Tax=Brachionus calyciflorus TaxID=104777 RepID=A0A814INA6_9BILA|nr:unnamed protein product [Brachionus calyciflorus]
MKFIFNYKDENKKLELLLSEHQTVKQVKAILQDFFKIDIKSTETETKNIVLEYNGSLLFDSWCINDLGIPMSATLRLYVQKEKHPDLLIYIKCQKETVKLYERDIDWYEWTVLELRVLLQNKIGFPLSIFRLKTSYNMDMFDEKKLSFYEINKQSLIIVETWVGWDALLSIAMKGYSKDFMNCLSSDDFIRQYQMKAGLFVACYYGNFELVRNLMTLGARVDRPVGEHPCRQWCKPEIKTLDTINKSNRIEYLKLEYLRCPIHAAILNGQLKVVNLISTTHIQALETKDGYGLLPWRLALHNNHKDLIKNLEQKEVARFLLGKRFGGKVNILENFSCSISFYSKLKYWAERAREKVFFYHGFAKSTLKKKTFHKGGLIGYKCLIDGYNNNFKDYVNSYDRLRPKYKFYYFYNQDEKDRYGYPDLYFKTLGLIKPQKQIHFSKSKTNKIKFDRPIPKTFQIWRNAFNKIIFRLTIRKYAEILIKLGVEIDMDELSLGDEKFEILKKVENDKKRRVSIKLPPIKTSANRLNGEKRLSEFKKVNSKLEVDPNKSFEKFRSNVSIDENAQIILNEVSFNLATKLASSNVKRLIREYARSLELEN